MIGAKLGPDEAYRVSRGETVTSFEGWQVKLHKPLDWIVVADHAENLGLADFIERSDAVCLANETCKRWHDLSKAGRGYEAFLEFARDVTTDQIKEPEMVKTMWSRVMDNADKYYEPGVFTTFTGYEWSPHFKGDNMHRVVIFRDGKERPRARSGTRSRP